MYGSARNHRSQTQTAPTELFAAPQGNPESANLLQVPPVIPQEPQMAARIVASIHGLDVHGHG